MLINTLFRILASDARVDPIFGFPEKYPAIDHRFSFLIEEVEKTLAPEYGPESPGEALDRLFERYQRVGDGPSGEAFVTTLICEILMLKVRQRSMEKREA